MNSSPKIFLLSVPLAAALLYACSGARPAGHNTSGADAAVTFQKRTFSLSKTPNPDVEAVLEDVLSSGYQAAVKKHYGDNPMEIGFTYSMSPSGAVYPFSEIEVSCIMQQKYARSKGPGLCVDFFSEVDARVKKALAKAASN